MSQYLMGKFAALTDLAGFIENGGDINTLHESAAQTLNGHLDKIASDNSQEYANGVMSGCYSVLGKVAAVVSEFGMEGNDPYSLGVDALNMAIDEAMIEAEALDYDLEKVAGIRDAGRAFLDQLRANRTVGNSVSPSTAGTMLRGQAGKMLTALKGMAGAGQVLGHSVANKAKDLAGQAANSRAGQVAKVVLPVGAGVAAGVAGQRHLSKRREQQAQGGTGKKAELSGMSFEQIQAMYAQQNNGQ